MCIFKSFTSNSNCDTILVQVAIDNSGSLFKSPLLTTYYDDDDVHFKRLQQGGGI
jgi:hypothetical protein